MSRPGRPWPTSYAPSPPIPRVGRLLFSVELSNTVIVRKRAESTALFAALLFAHAGA